MSNKLGMGKYRRGMTSALERAHDRIRELEAALREAIAQMESDVVFHEYDRGHRSISEMPDNDLPDALLHARATLARATVDRGGKQVGCEDEQGLLIVHPESETCHVCHTTDDLGGKPDVLG